MKKLLILLFVLLAVNSFGQEYSGNTKYIDGSLIPAIHTGVRNKFEADSGVWSHFRPVLVDNDTLRSHHYVASSFYVDSLFASFSVTETDPIYSAWDKSTGIAIDHSQISDWASATSSFLISYTETDPVWLSQKSSYLTIANAASTYEPIISKNTAFNKNFGSSSGTVAEGNDSRINNGQTAYGWGNHASAGYLLASTASTTYVPLTRTITINGTSYDLSTNRSWTIATGDSTIYQTLYRSDTGKLNLRTSIAAKFTLPSLTSGSILFSDGTTISQDNSNLFWDAINHRLGIETPAPAAKLDINSTSGDLFSATGNSVLRTTLNNSGSQVWYLNSGSSEVGKIAYSTPGGQPGILFFNTTSTGRSQIKQLASTGGLGFGATTLGTDPGMQMVLNTNGNVGIGATSPSAKLDVVGDIRATTQIYAPKIIINNGTTDNGLGQLQVTGNAWIGGTITISNTSTTIISGGTATNSKPTYFDNQGTSGGYNGGFIFRGGYNGGSAIQIANFYSTSSSKTAVGIGAFNDSHMQNAISKLLVTTRASSGSEPTYDPVLGLYANSYNSTSLSNGKQTGFYISGLNSGTPTNPSNTTSGVFYGFQYDPLTGGWGGTAIINASNESGSMVEVARFRGKDLVSQFAGGILIGSAPSYSNNAAAISGGLVAGQVYRNGDVLQIVH